MKRALILCPGRGSYSKDSLGSLNGLRSAALDVFEAMRGAAGRPGPREIDARAKFSSAFHIRGENASSLTAAVSLADIDQIDPSRFDICGVVGNSMGWYTALGVAGALTMSDCATLIETLGQYQIDNVVGGQIVYPLVDDEWRIDPERLSLVNQIVNQTTDLFWSIQLGGQAVLGGTEDALASATSALPERLLGAHRFPLRLPLHSAFHTPLMQEASSRALKDLQHLVWRAPSIPMVDGSGRVWRPHYADAQELRDYTLGEQVVTTFDLKDALRTALRNLGPDVVILPGPGSNLGSAVAQTMIADRWAGIDSRERFIQRQNSDPILLSMRWPDQRKRVVSP